MKGVVTQQQLKVLPVQLCGALLGVGCYLLYDDTALLPLGYGLLMGLCYSVMLYVGVSFANRLSEDSPEFGVGALMGSALVRFVIIGLLMAFGFKSFPNTPVAVMLPFVMVLLSPMVLVPFKKRLTD